ncbi:YbaY family lipoprotein [Vibrio sp. 10N.222.51.C8]|jgi:putative lipoprotein|uniref:YbaY family lipoprotein n=1 Tax=Vibrio TaxID=662 RepID=UPI0002E8DDC5|nr:MULTISPECIES: YbaY family lipoprotein [Vibrio]ANP77103.1 lipo-like protein [Vibrio crassostreae 9CS106]MCC4891236.1 YbaY family lipoprotein [Vibrio sp. F13]OCH54145.1 lipo-like protein [Vibrio sp. ZF57]OEE92165.1 lipo-like protein [Vibrio crassostreae 9ZC88]OEE98716.1 lipo-like protein [Vibrio crassostreae 9ZC77]
MKKALILITSLVSFGLLVGCQATSETSASQEVVAENTQVISGTVSYRERIALPENAVVTVTLEDISLADAPSTVIATQEFTTDGKQVPFAFELSYDNDKIKANHRYNMRASIHVDGKLRFITDTIKSVITDVENTQQADLRLVGVR